MIGIQFEFLWQGICESSRSDYNEQHCCKDPVVWFLWCTNRSPSCFVMNDGMLLSFLVTNLRQQFARLLELSIVACPNALLTSEFDYKRFAIGC